MGLGLGKVNHPRGHQVDPWQRRQPPSAGDPRGLPLAQPAQTPFRPPPPTCRRSRRGMAGACPIQHGLPGSNHQLPASAWWDSIMSGKRSARGKIKYRAFCIKEDTGMWPTFFGNICTQLLNFCFSDRESAQRIHHYLMLSTFIFCFFLFAGGASGPGAGLLLSLASQEGQPSPHGCVIGFAPALGAVGSPAAPEAPPFTRLPTQGPRPLPNAPRRRWHCRRAGRGWRCAAASSVAPTA